MNKVVYIVRNNSSFQITNAALKTEWSTHSSLSDKFNIDPASEKEVSVIIPGYSALPDTSTLKTSFVCEPEPGAAYSIARNMQATAVDSSLPVEIVNSGEFVRGTGNNGVKFILQNTSDVDIDIVTAQNISSPSSQIRFKLLDRDGNVLSVCSFLDGQTGDGFISLSGGDTRFGRAHV